MYNDAQNMLNNAINEELLRCTGVVAFYRACSNGDDISVLGQDGEVVETLHGLRQQVRATLFNP